MRHARRFGWILLPAILAALAFLVTDPGRAEEEGAKKAEDLPVRVYRIEDLFLHRDWGAQALGMTDVLEPERPWRFPGVYLGNSSGPHFGDVEGEPIEWQALVDIIQRTVSRASDPKVAVWVDQGGPAEIEYMALGKTHMLIVTQTTHGHDRIEGFLGELRGQSQVGGPMLTIHARWVELPDAKAADLLGRDPKRKVPMEVSAAEFDKAGATTVYRGATTTFDRMKVFVASGKLRTYLQDAEPVVAEGAIGVDPCTGVLLAGALLEVRPQLSSDGSRVILDFISYVNHTATVEPRPLPHWGIVEGARPPMKVALDTHSVDFHTLRGSVRVPLDKTVLLGVTTGPDLKAGRVMCLLVEVSASK